MALNGGVDHRPFSFAQAGDVTTGGKNKTCTYTPPPTITMIISNVNTHSMNYFIS